MDYKFIPSVCSEQEIENEVDGKITIEKVPATMKGHVMLVVPGFTQRQKLRSLALSVIQSEGKEQNHMALSKISEMVEMSKPFYKEVDLELLDGSQKFTSFEQMELDPRMEDVLKEIGTSLARGLSLPKA